MSLMLGARIARLRGGRLPPPLRHYLQQVIAESMAQPIRQSRFVVFDTETTGFDVRRDNVLQIGAVAVRGRAIIVGDSFESNVRSEHAGDAENIIVHGLRPSAMLEAPDLGELIVPFLEFLGGSVLVGHHVEFDRRIVSSNFSRYSPIRLYNRTVDTALLAARVECPGKSREEINWNDFRLDDLCQRYGIRRTERHTAAGDAFITAELFLRLLPLLEKRGVRTLADLVSDA